MTALESEVSLNGRTSGEATLRDILGAYVGLTKPRVIELLLLTTVPVMFFAQRGVPPLWLVTATVVVVPCRVTSSLRERRSSSVWSWSWSRPWCWASS